MGYLADLFALQADVHHTTVRQEEGPFAGEKAAAAARTPAVRTTTPFTYTYKCKSGKKGKGSKKSKKQLRKSLATGGFDATALPQLPGQVDLYPGAWSNYDTEAAATHGPGSLVMQALRNSQMPATRHPIYARGPHALQEATQLAKRHVYEYFGSTDGMSPQDYAVNVCVPPQDLSPSVYRAFITECIALAQQFVSNVGRYPAEGLNVTNDDVEYHNAYLALCDKYWARDTSVGNTKPIPARPQS